MGDNFGDGDHVAGVAPRATIIPVKVLNQNGSVRWCLAKVLKPNRQRGEFR